MEIRYVRRNCSYLQSIGISHNDIFLVREPCTENQYFIFAKKQRKEFAPFMVKI